MIRAVRFTPGTDAEAARGLLAYVRLEIGGLVLDGVTLRRHADGRLGLSWPERKDRAGRRHPLVRPVSDAARVEIEGAVLGELGRQELGRQGRQGDRAPSGEERQP